MNTLISILIATYNRVDSLVKIIELLEHQTFPSENYEIIVTDSFSCDETKTKVIELQNKYNNIVYKEDCKNILANKRNEGIRLAKADIIIFLDDDVYPFDMDFVKCHYIANKNNRDTFYCGQIRFDKNLVSKSNYYRFRDDQHLKDNSIGVDLPFYKIVVMNLSFRKEFIDKVGYVDERFINYGCEDTEFGFRIIKKGFRFKYLSGAKAIHRENSKDIIEYSKKIIKTKIYGKTTLYEVCPEIKQYMYQTKFDKKTFINLILFNKLFFKVIEFYLLFTDRVSLCYNYILYKYYLFCVSYYASCD